MADPINSITLGGLTFDKTQVEKITSNDKGEYTVVFKTGETLTYPEQSHYVPCDFGHQYASIFIDKDGNHYEKGKFSPWKADADYPNYKGDKIVQAMRPAKPEVTLNVVDGLFYDDTYFKITDVMGATFTTSEHTVAKVKLEDCQETTVDLAANNSSFLGDKAVIKGGNDNQVILDAEDTATINDKRIGPDSAGTANQKDY